jgi:hypothetical protein
MDIWKPIKDYENLYEISTQGKIRSLHNRYGINKLLKSSKNSKGYRVVTLCKDKKQKTFTVHKLVAAAFIPNPNNYPCVNHKNENKDDNSVDNLEWCTYYYNNVYGQRLTKSALKRSKPVMCIETRIVYPSATRAAQELKLHQGNISKVCNGKAKTAGGYHWEHV